MSRFRVNLIFEDGSVSEDDEVFDSYEEAEDYGEYLVNCYFTGVEVLNWSDPVENPETVDDVDADFEVIEIDE